MGNTKKLKEKKHKKDKKHKKTHNVKSIKVNKQKGGNLTRSCPFPLKRWDVNNGGQFFILGIPIGVGNTPPFPGNQNNLSSITPTNLNYRNLSSQNGGKTRKHKGGVDKMSNSNDNNSNNGNNCNNSNNNNTGTTINTPRSSIPTPMLNASRLTVNFIENLVRQFQGLPPIQSPLPTSQNQQQV